MEKSTQKPIQKSSFLELLKQHKKPKEADYDAPMEQITQSDMFLYGGGITTVASLLGKGRKLARARQLIYEKWQVMEADPIVSTAVMLLVTAALGGHETSGELVFIESKAEIEKDKKLSKMVDEIRESLSAQFNNIAFQLAYLAAIYGDAFVRVYSEQKEGVISLDMNELIRPQLVQAFEQGGKTVGFAVTIGPKNFEKLSVLQMARMRMPRTQWIPQFGVVEKSIRSAITEDDITKLPVMPAMVGGSLLFNAETAYDNLIAALLGLVGQRWLDSIDEQMMTVNCAGMSIEQQKRFLTSVKSMLSRSKEVAEKAIKQNRPVLERVRHIIAVNNDKQLTQLSAMGNGAGRNGSLTTDDIMLHAKLLAGALGVDLSMLGFADILSGGLGEGGFFRTSAQVAERARIIRTALTECFNNIIDIHTLKKYGLVFEDSERPWQINFFGSISAYEAEKTRTRMEAQNAGAILVQTLQQAKDLGMDETQLKEFLSKTMQLDEDQAELFAKLANQKPPEGEDGMGAMGGGF